MATKKKKAAKKKVARKIKVVKTRNAGTMTEAQFFGWLRQVLRKASIYWKPIAQVRKEAQIHYKGPNKRRKFSYVCNNCKKEFAGTEVHVHHLIECGNLMSFQDLPGFVERLFCEKQGLILVCKSCHDKIHKK